MTLNIITKALLFYHPFCMIKVARTRYTHMPKGGPRNPEKEIQLKQELIPFLKENGMREDIEFCIFSSENFFSSRGANLLWFLPAKVIIEPNLLDIDREAAIHSIKHEIGHIKHNDAITIPCVNTLTSIAVGILFPYLIESLGSPESLANVITFVAQIAITFAVLLSFNRYREGVADDFSNRKSTNAELLGGLRFYRNLAAEKGQDSLTHPPLVSRIAKIKNELEQRRISTAIDLKETAIYKFREMQHPGIHKSLS